MIPRNTVLRHDLISTTEVHDMEVLDFECTYLGVGSGIVLEIKPTLGGDVSTV